VGNASPITAFGTSTDQHTPVDGTEYLHSYRHQLRATENDYTARFSSAIQGAVLVTLHGKIGTKIFATLSHPIILVRVGRGTREWHSWVVLARDVGLHAAHAHSQLRWSLDEDVTRPDPRSQRTDVRKPTTTALGNSRPRGLRMWAAPTLVCYTHTAVTHIRCRPAGTGPCQLKNGRFLAWRPLQSIAQGGRRSAPALLPVCPHSDCGDGARYRRCYQTLLRDLLCSESPSLSWGGTLLWERTRTPARRHGRMAARKSVALPRAPCNPHRQGPKSSSPFENEVHGSLVGKRKPHSGRKKRLYKLQDEHHSV